MYVFRESHRVAPAGRLLAELADAVRRAAFSNELDDQQDALLRAGDLECVLADTGQQSGALQVAGVTDCLASALVRGDRLVVAESCLQILNSIELSGEVAIRTPEGFAYYGLHPLDYARLVERHLEECQNIAGAAVLGIRTIGTTLSAVVEAELRRHRIAASRITVRPHGHPFRRECRFSHEQRDWVAERACSGDKFFIVDEGPGLSGSSFLSVANALQVEGVDPEDIVFFCSRVPDVASFCTETSRELWPRFHSVAATSQTPSVDEFADTSWGQLRSHAFELESEWPASWTHMERRKFLSADGSELLKFEGHGKYGEAPFARAKHLADAGLGPKVLGRANGFTRYAWIESTPLRPEDLDEAMVDRLARYCDFRAAEFSAESDSRDAVDLEAMTRVNLLEEFGSEESSPDLSPLHTERNVITDSRMMPHAWIRGADGQVLKTNGSLHGDDHFFPGPCNIAWDLAGAIVEWEMGECVANHFLGRFAQLSGDDPKPRIPAFITAYAACRMGYCKMAAEAMKGSDEEGRLRRNYLRYRDALAQKNAIPELARAA
jgi:hypothetical protein